MEHIHTSLYLIVFLSSLFFALTSVPMFSKAAFKLNIVDRPDQAHKTHLNPVPYLGGLTIITPTFLLCIFGGFYLNGGANLMRLATFLVPVLFISIVGLVDDYKNLSASSRLWVQLITSIFVSMALIEFGFTSKITDYKFLDFLISIFWIVGITNSFNLIDNLDGGAAGIGFIAAISSFLLSAMSDQYLIALLSICLAGAVLGFLFWNFAPAKIYLGDSGSLFLGITFSILLLQFEPTAETMNTSVVIPILVLAVPIIDTTVVVISRVFRGVPVFQGERNHLSHRIQKLGYSRKITALILWLISGILSTFGLAINYFQGNVGIYLAVIGLGMMGIVTICFLLLPFD